MNPTKLMLAFGTLALAVVSAADTYRVSLHETTLLSGKQIKPGDYKIEVNGGRAVIKDGKKELAESPVRVETGSEKFSATRIRYDNGDGKYHLREIHLGGTNTKLVFAGESAGASAN
jgi:hypothetical protein